MQPATAGGRLKLWLRQEPLSTTVIHLTSSTRFPQAKRLDELDRLYRDEALARKKTHNAMEDLKVGWHPVLR